MAGAVDGPAAGADGLAAGVVDEPAGGVFAVAPPPVQDKNREKRLSGGGKTVIMRDCSRAGVG